MPGERRSPSTTRAAPRCSSAGPRPGRRSAAWTTELLPRLLRRRRPRDCAIRRARRGRLLRAARRAMLHHKSASSTTRVRAFVAARNRERFLAEVGRAARRPGAPGRRRSRARGGGRPGGPCRRGAALARRAAARPRPAAARGGAAARRCARRDRLPDRARCRARSRDLAALESRARSSTRPQAQPSRRRRGGHGARASLRAARRAPRAPRRSVVAQRPVERDDSPRAGRSGTCPGRSGSYARGREVDETRARVAPVLVGVPHARRDAQAARASCAVKSTTWNALTVGESSRPS